MGDVVFYHPIQKLLIPSGAPYQERLPGSGKGLAYTHLMENGLNRIILSNWTVSQTPL
jgi:hypothetical protein